MAYDERLAARVRDHLEGLTGIVEKQMFGGLSFLLDGNLAVGVIGDELCVRVGPEQYEEALAQPGAGAFDFTGRPMRGWLVVAAEAVTSEPELGAWVERGLTFAATLPAK